LNPARKRKTPPQLVSRPAPTPIFFGVRLLLEEGAAGRPRPRPSQPPLPPVCKPRCGKGGGADTKAPRGASPGAGPTGGLAKKKKTREGGGDGARPQTVYATVGYPRGQGGPIQQREPRPRPVGGPGGGALNGAAIFSVGGTGGIQRCRLGRRGWNVEGQGPPKEGRACWRPRLEGRTEGGGARPTEIRARCFWALKEISAVIFVGESRGQDWGAAGPGFSGLGRARARGRRSKARGKGGGFSRRRRGGPAASGRRAKAFLPRYTQRTPRGRVSGGPQWPWVVRGRASSVQETMDWAQARGFFAYFFTRGDNAVQIFTMGPTTTNLLPKKEGGDRVGQKRGWGGGWNGQGGGGVAAAAQG